MTYNVSFDKLIDMINDCISYGKPIIITVENNICHISTIVWVTSIDADGNNIIIYDDMNGGIYEINIKEISVGDDGEIQIIDPNDDGFVMISFKDC